MFDNPPPKTIISGSNKLITIDKNLDIKLMTSTVHDIDYNEY